MERKYARQKEDCFSLQIYHKKENVVIFMYTMGALQTKITCHEWSCNEQDTENSETKNKNKEREQERKENIQIVT